jgi:hypothetical protein
MKEYYLETHLDKTVFLYLCTLQRRFYILFTFYRIIFSLYPWIYLKKFEIENVYI